MNTKSLGALLKEWRIESNLSQVQLGRSAGLSRKTIGNIERGDRAFDNEQIVRLCKALGRSVEELILHWSRSSLEELQQIERELQGVEAGPALARPASGSVEEIFDRFGALLKELYHRAQEELIHTLQLQMGPPGSSSPSPPAALKRTRSRVSRKGRVRAGST
jgi:transcriptional regulator with XRE-family HTH domain